jgi:multidrug transporter EmrE-like cation transporter
MTNVGIIVASTIAAWLFFKEKLSIFKIAGIAMAIAAILLMQMG